MTKNSHQETDVYAFGNSGHSLSGPLFHELPEDSAYGMHDQESNAAVAQPPHLRLLPPDSARRPDATRAELLEHQIESS